MIPPASIAVIRRCMFLQPLERTFRLIPPGGVTGGVMKTQKSPSQKAHTLGRTTRSDSQHRSQVEGKAPNSLLQAGSQEWTVERERSQEASAEAVESVVAAVVISLQPLDKPVDGVVHFHLQQLSSRRKRFLAPREEAVSWLIQHGLHGLPMIGWNAKSARVKLAMVSREVADPGPQRELSPSPSSYLASEFPAGGAG